MADILSVFAPYGPWWLLGILLLIGIGWLVWQFLEEYKRQNQRRADLDIKREERKVEEAKEVARRDRERSEMEGRIASQMERSNALMESMKTLMESVVQSNNVLHNDLVHSQGRSAKMASDVDHIKDRIDLMYEREQK